jgi:hypothetical protein
MNRREKERREERRARLRKWASEPEQSTTDSSETDDNDCANDKLAIPSQSGIRCIAAMTAETLEKGVIVCGRESGRTQNLDSLLKAASFDLGKRGVNVIRGYGDVAKGWKLDPISRPELHLAIAHARRIGCPLLFPTFNRLIRPRLYNRSNHVNLRPRVSELDPFMKLADGIQILTLNNPDSSPAEDDNFLRQLRADCRGTNVGRPKKMPKGYLAARRARYWDLVMEWAASGISLRKIAKMISEEEDWEISQNAIWKWCQQMNAGPGLSQS